MEHETQKPVELSDRRTDSALAPQIFNYVDYRRFMRDQIDYLRACGTFSLRKFSKKAGFRSSSFLNLILANKRNLSDEGAKKCAQGLELDPFSLAYFIHLVRFTQAARDLEIKSAASEALRQLRNHHQIKYLEEQQYRFLTNWYMPVLLEAFGIRFQIEGPHDSIASELGISTIDVRRALDCFQALELISCHDGVWQRTHFALRTPDEFSKLAVRKMHSDTLEVISRQILSVDPSERSVGSLTLNLSQESFIKLKAKIVKVFEEAHAEFLTEKDPQSVYQLNIQLLPLLKLKMEGKEGV
jgi:uncharacterized protein (TIGR02147 family)